MNVTGGATDVTTYFKLHKTADGLEATGLTITDFDLQYTRSGVAPTAKVDATALAATDSAHADNKAIEIDSTDQPGVYRVDWPDAAFAAGVKEVILTLKHASCWTEELRVTIDAPVNVTSLNAGQQSLLDLKDFADDGYDPSTNKVAGVVLVDTLTTYTGNTPQTADHTANVSAIKTKTDFLPSATAGSAGGVFIAGSNAATTMATFTVSGAVAFQSTFAVTTSTALAALSCSTLTASGAVAFQSTFIVTGATTLTGAVTASNASNNIVGIDVAKLAGTAYGSSTLFTLASHDPGETIMGATDAITVTTNNDKTGYSLANGSFVTATFGTCDLTSTMKASVNTEVLDVLNVDTLIDGKTLAQAVMYIGAITAGRISGAGTGTEVFKGLDESTTRVTVTVDASGNRSDIVYG